MTYWRKMIETEETIMAKKMRRTKKTRMNLLHRWYPEASSRLTKRRIWDKMIDCLMTKI